MTKLRHAAALALVGWYLMIPPRPSEKSFRDYDAAAPLAQWGMFQAFDTAADCEQMLSQMRNPAHLSPSDLRAMLKRGLKPLNGAQLKDEREFMFHALCIASDDPRLAK